MRRTVVGVDPTRLWRRIIATGMALLIVLHLAPGPEFRDAASHAALWAGLALYAALLWLRDRGSPPGIILRLRRIGWIMVMVLAVGLVFGWHWPMLAISCGLIVLSHLWSGYLRILAWGINPGFIFVGSFAVLIGLGTIALKHPEATPPDQPITWTDALFTSTSAACVTGLVVRDTGTGFTRAGQWVILSLIQLGGLGMILFGALVAVIFGSSISLKAVHAMSAASPAGAASPSSMKRLVLFTAAIVFGTELLGALLLAFGWPEQWSGGPANLDSTPDRLFHGLFFSVSAFCNAGFATNATGVEGLRTHWTSHLVIAGLVTIGGLGLPVIANLAQLTRLKVRSMLGRREPRQPGDSLVRLSFHSKLALTTTALVYLVGLIAILISEMTLRDIPAPQAILDAHFMSVASRTAGFNTVPTVETGPLARFWIIILMFIGGSPGSTAGGLKTIALAVLVIIVWRTITGREETDAFGRRIPGEMIRRAVALLILNLTCIILVTSALLLSEAGRFAAVSDEGAFEALFFEAVSACATVGLSLGVTPTLSEPGRYVIVVGMFLGRVGSLAFLVALVGITRQARTRYTFPAEGVVLS